MSHQPNRQTTVSYCRQVGSRRFVRHCPSLPHPPVPSPWRQTDGRGSAFETICASYSAFRTRWVLSASFGTYRAWWRAAIECSYCGRWFYYSSRECKLFAPRSHLFVSIWRMIGTADLSHLSLPTSFAFLSWTSSCPRRSSASSSNL